MDTLMAIWRAWRLLFTLFLMREPCDANHGDLSMNRDHRYAISLCFLDVCLLVSSCAGSKQPFLEASNDNVAGFEESTKELRKLAQGGDASAQSPHVVQPVGSRTLAML